jgi:peptidoglycan/LPS O-acetylase OafA/YrhL
MPGITRFFLSVLVIFSHLSGAESAEHFGYYAVRAFFILSGLMMTKALHENYQFNFFRFYSNRLLRILPLYLLVCVATLVVIRLFPEQTAQFMPRWSFDASVDNILQNFLLLPLAAGYLQFRFLEPAWSLAVELVMYLLLWVGIARSQRLAVLALIFGATYHLVLLANGAAFSVRYFSIPSAILSYSIGALVYFHYDRLKNHGWLGPLAAMAWFGNVLLGDMLWGARANDVGFYANTILFGLAAPCLLELRLSRAMAAHDRVLGQLSYPIFLVQWLAGFAGFLLLRESEGRGVILFYLSIPVAVALGAVLTLANEWMVEPIRTSLRKRVGPLRAIDFSRNAAPASAPAQ